jgi:Gpi18-like mannosyltransferase
MTAKFKGFVARWHSIDQPDWAFPLVMGLLSRSLLIFLILGIAPLLPTPPDGLPVEFNWSAFNAWDSVFYESIATRGYEYFANDPTQGHNVAFFPVFPLLCWLLMQLGLPFDAAGTIVNNAAFLGALIILHPWVKHRYGQKAAFWITAVVAWCPFSIFGTFIYTEGVFLCVSIAALRAFDEKKYRYAALWGAIATATRANGVALIPTFFLVSWRQKRGSQGYLTALFTGTGLALYSLYCGLRFGDFLAFARIQQAWDRSAGIDWNGWKIMASQLLFGSESAIKGLSRHPSHFIALTSIFAIAFLLWRYRPRVRAIAYYYSYCVLFLLSWLIAGDFLVDTLTIFGGGYLLWQQRHHLGSLLLSYGAFSYFIIFNSGSTISAERFVYATISVAIAFGLLLSRYPRWGYAVISFFILLLALYGIRFAQTLWVA